MSDRVICVENLSKRYRLGTLQRNGATSLREAAMNALTFPFRFLKARVPSPSANRSQATHQAPEHIWALRDVSFEVQQGEVLGIIGRNGAGKSTLLKVLAGITRPTAGYGEVHGRIASLLEVGAGFHPELTGRENIYLNGSILGMKKSEIGRKFDEIVAFAEIEKFIDTPVKRYSSGMYVRLAFAVAAHLEPEILLVDEVLAVGDAAFQKKCLGKVNNVAKQGRTVLFVSHNMSAIGRLCSRAMWFDGGKLLSTGNARSVITEYMASSDTAVGYREWPDLDSAPGDKFLQILSLGILDLERKPTNVLFQGFPFIISIVYKVHKPMTSANVGFELCTEVGTIVFTSFDVDHPEWSGQGRKPGIYTADCIIPAHFLNEGTYTLTLLAGIPFFRLILREEDVLSINIAQPISGEVPSGRMGVRRAGVVAPNLEWRVNCTQ